MRVTSPKGNATVAVGTGGANCRGGWHGAGDFAGTVHTGDGAGGDSRHRQRGLPARRGAGGNRPDDWGGHVGQRRDSASAISMTIMLDLCDTVRAGPIWDARDCRIQRRG